MYRLRIKETFGNQKLNEVTRKQVQLFHNRLLTDGLKPASADHYASWAVTCKPCLPNGLPRIISVIETFP